MSGTGLRGGDRGTTMVEFALVSTVAFLLLFTFTDAALVVLGNSVGSNAARDGARTGIVNFHDADVTGSATRLAIEGAVRSRLAGNITDVTITVTCRTADLTTAKLCRSDLIDVGRDFIDVRVQWKHKGSSPFFPVTTHTATSRMVISGPPTPS